MNKKYILIFLLTAFVSAAFVLAHNQPQTATQEPTEEQMIIDTDIQTPELPYTDADIEMLAKMVWGEARGCSPEEWRLVVWTVLQRVDADRWGNTIEEVVTARRQFVGYRTENPICPDIHAVVIAELSDWIQGAEPPTHEIYAPTVPYYYFDGDGRNNWFREVWRT